MRFFISFSSQDGPAVRELMAGFKSQDIGFWDYSDIIEEIESGKVVNDCLFAEINKADYFVAIISNNTTDTVFGKNTRLEVQYAIDRGLLKEGKIIPVELQKEKDRFIPYSGPYKELEGLLHHHFEVQNTNSYIDVLRAVTKRVSLPYVPMIEEHPRLPFWEKFRNEVISLGQSNSTHVNLMTTLGKFNEYMKTDNFDQAFREISHFVDAALYQIPGYRPEYPYVVKAVCAQELGKIDVAEESYREVLSNNPNNPDALGGLGIINMHYGNYSQAADWFGLASKNSDPDQARMERVNKVVAVLSGRLSDRYSFADKSFVLNIKPENLIRQDERFACLKAKALIYYHDREFKQAIQIYQELEKENALNETGSIVYYFNSVKLNKSKSPDQILERGIERSQTFRMINANNLRQRLADYYFEIGKRSQAHHIYKNFLIPPICTDRGLMAAYALILKKMGDKNECIKVCLDLLSFKTFGNPTIFPDFYYCGLANYLLGNIPRAEYDFERSNGFGLWYEQYNV
jgi:tetratricopeptide (TPR) repeat protein